MAALLIVDDDPTIRDTLCQLFSDKYRCDAAAEWNHALKLLEAQEYDAIVTDISLPDASGLQILNRIQALNLATPTIVISASGDQSKDFFLEMGAFAYFSKPFRFEELESAVARAVGSLHRQ